MISIDRPALRVSSHRRRAAALAAFLRRHCAARSPDQDKDGVLDSAGIERLLHEQDHQS
ncbi:hypothetical protein SAMN06295905_1096 [Devosia lucknowensis]|uniref:Uncharacterized protein n=1 Tax=Devosia lucknowensis TaxID=1096929 RepID=A0A1Y6EUM1_9HYPH|nr:hypothetical protein [Devosia lucknowensis]SMQ64931.1 hypothetical protein SAMN06295905_1096 [Devosia lucknowensis]